MAIQRRGHGLLLNCAGRHNLTFVRLGQIRLHRHRHIVTDTNPTKRMTIMKSRSGKLSAFGTSLALLGTALVASANLVTYQMDMSVQMTLGNFNPATDRVLVAGSFSTPDWINPATTAFALTNDPGNNPNIYKN